LYPKSKPLRLPTNRSEQHGNSTALRAPDHHWAWSAANRKSPSARWAKLACDALSSFVPITGAATPLLPSPMAGQMIFKIVRRLILRILTESWSRRCQRTSARLVHVRLCRDCRARFDT